MNRSSFLKSLATLIAAPSLIAQVKESKIVSIINDTSQSMNSIGEFHKKFLEEREKQIWYGSPKQKGASEFVGLNIVKNGNI